MMPKNIEKNIKKLRELFDEETIDAVVPHTKPSRTHTQEMDHRKPHP